MSREAELRASRLTERADDAERGVREAYEAGARLRGDARHAEELARQSRPLLERALEAGDADDREAAALAHLLGRRASDLEVSPTAALLLADVVIAALEVERPAGASALRARVMEGFGAAARERAEAVADLRAAEAIPVIRVAPRCFAVLFAGRHGDTPIAEVVDAIGRRLLDGDARACAVDLSALRAPTGELMRQLLALHGTCRMLGVAAIFGGLRVEARDAAAEARVELDELWLADDFPSALEIALGECGLEISAPGAWARTLRRLGL